MRLFRGIPKMQRTLERLHNSEKGEDTRRNGDESHQLRRKLWHSCSTVSGERCRYLLVMKVLRSCLQEVTDVSISIRGIFRSRIDSSDTIPGPLGSGI